MSEVRHRTSAKRPEPVAMTPAARAKEEDSTITLLDICRGVVFVVLISSALSWFVTRDSLVWNIQRPAFTRLDVIKIWINGPKQYTDAELKQYDGSNPDLPLLLAINGTVYDVSAGRRHYGPGGSYHFFAGADASRAFVTNCFDTDISPDMRGVEAMFMPKDDPEVDALYEKGELKKLREQERRKAKEEVHKALKHWVDFFGGSKKYTKVGRVQRAEGWENRGPVPVLCASAEQKRKSRSPPPKV